MNSAPTSILLVEDSPSDAALLQEALHEVGPGQFQFTHVETLAEGLAQVGQSRFDALLLDLSLPDSVGRETFLRVRGAAPELPIVVLTGVADDALGLEAVRQGIQDYLRKGQADGAQTSRAIRYAIERQRMEAELRRARDELELRVAERTAELSQSVEALRKEIGQRQQAEAALRESEERYRKLFEAAPVGIAVSNYQGKMIAANRLLCAMGGVTPEEARTLRTSAFHALPGQRRQLLAQVRKHGRAEQSEALLKRKDGSTFLGLVHMEELRLGREKVLLTIVQDITKQKQNEWHIEGVRELLELFATKTSRQDYLESVVGLLRGWCGCRCAGIRLVDDQGRMPYTAWAGYSRRFLKEESRLCLGHEDCICLRAFDGKTRAEDGEFVSHKGSFFCNSSSRFAARLGVSPTACAQLPCLEAHYESLAHTPIRYHGHLLGTIHLADPRAGCFPAETTRFVESVAPLVGEALHRFQVEESLHGERTAVPIHVRAPRGHHAIGRTEVRGHRGREPGGSGVLRLPSGASASDERQGLSTPCRRRQSPRSGSAPCAATRATLSFHIGWRAGNFAPLRSTPVPFALKTGCCSFRSSTTSPSASCWRNRSWTSASRSGSVWARICTIPWVGA